MRRIIFFSGLLIVILAFTGCKTGKSQVSDNNGQVVLGYRMTGGEQSFYPKATLIKIEEKYADKVGVSLNADGSIAYYPAPTDLNKDSAPYPLDHGWYLNRQGVGKNTVFTSWTFDDYMSLNAPPSIEEIKEAIIPGSCVIEMKEAPVSLSEALSDPENCKKYTK